MPGKPEEKPHRIRVRTLDGKGREVNKLKSNQLRMPHVDIYQTDVPSELIICAVKDTHIEEVRAKLGGAELEEIEGDTTIPIAGEHLSTGPQNEASRRSGGGRRGGKSSPSADFRGGNRTLTPETDKADLKKKPYGFVSLPAQLTTTTPVWHDGTSSAGKLSGEVRFEIEALTPLLVGWERGLVGDDEPSDWPITARPEGKEHQKMKLNGRWCCPVATKKSVLCPLRAPWGDRPVIIPGDSLKGLLRHELGALLGAPMERVAERSYSYRPNVPLRKENTPLPNGVGERLVARLARVPKDDDCVETKSLDGAGGEQVRVPTRLELLPTDLRYDKPGDKRSNYYRFNGGGAPYRGGLGAGQQLSPDSRTKLYRKINVNYTGSIEAMAVSQSVQNGYLATLRHLIDPASGHFSERHPGAKKYGNRARTRVLDAAKSVVFQPGDIIWVEWDSHENRVVSLGWHYYYRWAYTDTVRERHRKHEVEQEEPLENDRQRHGLFPLDDERKRDDHGAPVGLSVVRRLFGYTGDNDGSTGIGEGDHEQLMGRLFPNAAIEVLESGDTDESRFLAKTYLKELGMPRPSAVEHYLKQPHHPQSRPSDQAKLVTYGDAAGYDEGGELAGRKFYLDRADAETGPPWEDNSEDNRLENDRSTLALEASKPGRRFRFTLRFRDLDPVELAAVLVALCPDQFKDILGGAHVDGYCSKLGYARPLGWGSVSIEAKALLWLDATAEKPTMTPEPNLTSWVRENHAQSVSQDEWLAIHRRKHPDAADYPRAADKIYTFHSKLRGEHSKARRYTNKEMP